MVEEEPRTGPLQVSRALTDAMEKAGVHNVIPILGAVDSVTPSGNGSDADAGEYLND